MGFGGLEDFLDLGGGVPMDTDGGMGFGGQPAQQPHEKVEMPLNLSLEDLYKGGVKKLRVTRHIVDGASGKRMPVQEVLEVPIKAGWKEGTKVTYEGKGDELPGRPPADLVFVVKQAPHPVFERRGDDLVARVPIPLATALTGGSASLETLDKRTLQVPVREPVSPDTELTIPCEGMPISKRPNQKGNMKVKFNIQFPRRLTDTQKAQLRSILADA